ncbi:MAG: hypothetical protein ACXVBW_05550, partial [Bdellovibrionota bacterium]
NSTFTLSGARINKLGEGRFQTHWGEYTTCVDCPGSWSFLAEDVDMQIEGYAFMTNVIGKIKAAPIGWSPILVIPLKTKRQTGFLFPRFSLSGSVNFMQPFFWAINRWSDMTISAGYIGVQGPRVEWEGRYNLGSDVATATAFYTHDGSFVYKNPSLSNFGFPLAGGPGQTVDPNRWSASLKQSHSLPFSIDEKFVLNLISDNAYPYTFGNDIQGGGEKVLPSSLSFSYGGSSSFSAFTSMTVYRNLINTSDNTSFDSQMYGFDRTTVQPLPVAGVVMNDRQLFGIPLFVGFNTDLHNFIRQGGPFDIDRQTHIVTAGGQPTYGMPVPFGTVPIPGIDPLREALRVSFNPQIYSSWRPLDVIAFVPSLQYKGFYYNFSAYTNSPGTPSVADLYRGYVLAQVDLSTQLERIYDFPGADPNPLRDEASRAKHLFRPFATLSYIPDFTVSPASSLSQDPTVQAQQHPFIQQIQYAAKNHIPGYYFDDYDIIPINSVLSPDPAVNILPLGGSLAFGFTTQWIRKLSSSSDPSAPASYQTAIELKAAEALNFRDQSAVDTGVNHLWQNLNASLAVNYKKFSWVTSYMWIPYIASPSHIINSGVGYVFERAVHQGILAFERSVALSYAYDAHAAACAGNPGSCGTNQISLSTVFSINDYFMPSLSIGYNFAANSFPGAGFGLSIQSPSRCWKVDLAFGFTPVTQPGLSPFSFSPNITLNLTGSGFSGFSEFVQSVASH